MKNFSHKFLFGFLIFSLFACSTGFGAPMPSETSQALPTVTEEKLAATQTHAITPTIPPITPTPTFEPSLDDAHLTIKCLEISPTLPENTDLSGKLILFRDFINGKGFTADGNAIMDLHTRTLTPIEDEIVSISVSPDRERLAYFYAHHGADGKRDAITLVIKNRNGKVLAKVPGDVEYWDTFYWLDSQRVVIGMYGQPLVLNPFTRESYDLSKWYAASPGGLHIVPVWDVNGVFDSKLERLFYVQEDMTMLLWDLQAKKILAKLDHYSKYWPGDQPKWSWDDKEVVVGYASTPAANFGEELFSINRDGEIKQLTELGKYDSQTRISKFSWSPDGHHIAFFFRDLSQKDSQYQFAVLNRETLQVMDYCNLSGLMNPNVEPIWSPDGTKILIGRMDADQTVKTILVDIVSEYAAPLAENLVPVGWMKAPKP